MQLGLPFASKELPDGKRLFRRVHGFQVTLNANGDTELEITVPYLHCKITEARVFWAPEGLTCDMKIYDNEACSMQVALGVPEAYRVPNLMLDKFGFDVNIAKDYHVDISPYDADLFQGMKIVVVFKNPTDATPKLGVNLVLHEVK